MEGAVRCRWLVERAATPEERAARGVGMCRDSPVGRGDRLDFDSPCAGGHTCHVPAAPKWGTSPRKSIEAECKRLGKGAFVAGCIALLAGRDADPKLLLALGGRPARWAAGFDEPPGPAYWLRVWAARGLLWAWDDQAVPSVLKSLTDDAWRVREMATRVVIRHHVADALPIVRRLKGDTNARVRRAAERAVVNLGGDDN